MGPAVPAVLLHPRARLPAGVAHEVPLEPYPAEAGGVIKEVGLGILAVPHLPTGARLGFLAAGWTTTTPTTPTSSGTFPTLSLIHI